MLVGNLSPRATTSAFKLLSFMINPALNAAILEAGSVDGLAAADKK
jgi:hypothetical protein